MLAYFCFISRYILSQATQHVCRSEVCLAAQALCLLDHVFLVLLARNAGMCCMKRFAQQRCSSGKVCQVLCLKIVFCTGTRGWSFCHKTKFCLLVHFDSQWLKIWVLVAHHEFAWSWLWFVEVFQKIYIVSCKSFLCVDVVKTWLTLF